MPRSSPELERVARWAAAARRLTNIDPNAFHVAWVDPTSDTPEVLNLDDLDVVIDMARM